MKFEYIAVGDRLVVVDNNSQYPRKFPGVVLSASSTKVSMQMDSDKGVREHPRHVLVHDDGGLSLTQDSLSVAARLLAQWCEKAESAGAALEAPIAAWWKVANRVFTSQKMTEAYGELKKCQVKVDQIKALGGLPASALEERIADLEAIIEGLREKMRVLYSAEIAAAVAAESAPF